MTIFVGEIQLYHDELQEKFIGDCAFHDGIVLSGKAIRLTVFGQRLLCLALC